MSSIIFIITAPSGAGKTSLSRAMLRHDPRLSLSVSYTTRAPRRQEKDGEHYHFVSHERFQQMIAEKDFLEYAMVHGHYYGTSHEAMSASLSSHDVLVDIDWQGAAQIRAVSTHPVVDIFITPPSLSALATRLQQRGEDSEDVMSRRLVAAREELTHLKEFQYVVQNEQFEVALSDLLAIVRTARLRYEDRDALLSRIVQV